MAKTIQAAAHAAIVTPDAGRGEPDQNSRSVQRSDTIATSSAGG
jgi:hypothetical protein